MNSDRDPLPRPWPFPVQTPAPTEAPAINLDSDEPLTCPLRKPGDDETCESCQ